MARFRSKIDTRSEDFRRNRVDMLAMVDQIQLIKQRAFVASEKRKPRFDERGQLTPRARLARLLDPGMPWLELFGMANYLVGDTNPKSSVPGASALAGVGYVSGVRCMVFASDSGINAGASTPMSGEKMRSCLDMSRDMKLPFIQLVESAGANLLKYQVEGWANGGGMFRRLAQLSAAGIPTISVLHGPSTAGGAYYPGLSDYVIGVKGRGRASLGGAALVRAATGEIADEEELAGSEMHASISGLVEFLADDDEHALQQARGLVARLHWNKRCEPPPSRAFSEPFYSPDELAGVVPIDYRKPYDVREVIARVVDDSDFEDFKPRYGATVVCVQATIFGHACGIIGNNGPIDTNGATKAAQFIQLCDQADMPLVFLQNITGYMVGKAYEQAGMIKHGSKMIQAVANVRVPKLTLYIGASYGAGNYGMAGYAYEPAFLFAWPNSTSGVMGGEQAATTMDQVMRFAARRRGEQVDEAALQAQHDQLVAHFTSQESAAYTSGRLLDQGIIDPRDSRKVLAFGLETCREAQHRTVRPNSFGVARL